MLEKIAFVLFYAVMALVAVTCLSQLVTLTAFHDANWFSAWGSWVSGVGTFGAVGAALFVSSRDRRDRDLEHQRELRYKQHSAAYRLLLFAQEYIARLQEVDIGRSIDEPTWIALRISEASLPYLHMSSKISDIHDLSTLGYFMELGFSLEQEAFALNMLLDRYAHSFSLAGRNDVFDILHAPLTAAHARAQALSERLEEFLPTLRASGSLEL